MTITYGKKLIKQQYYIKYKTSIIYNSMSEIKTTTKNDIKVPLQSLDSFIRKAHKYANETVTKHVDNTSFCFTQTHDACYNIVLTNIKNVENIVLNIGGITFEYKINPDASSFQIDTFTESEPLLMTHLLFSTIRINAYTSNSGNYSYDVTYTGRYLFLGFIKQLWYKTPVIHYVKYGRFILYREDGFAELIHTSELYKHNLSTRSVVDRHFVSENIDEWTVCVKGNPDLPEEAFKDSRILAIAARIPSMTIQTFPPIKEIYIKGKEDLESFMELSKQLWNNETYIYKQHYKINEEETKRIQKINNKKIKHALDYINSSYYPECADYSNRISDENFLSELFQQDSKCGNMMGKLGITMYDTEGNVTKL